MAKTKTYYCMETPEENLLVETISSTKTECWDASFAEVSHALGIEWLQKYWKRREASRRAADKLGWKIVPVQVLKMW